MVDRTPKRRGEPLEQSSKRARSTTGRVGIREQEGSEHEESDEEEDGGGGGVVAAELMHDLDSEDTEAGRGGVGSHERADAVDGAKGRGTRTSTRKPRHEVANTRGSAS